MKVKKLRDYGDISFVTLTVDKFNRIRVHRASYLKRAGARRGEVLRRLPAADMRRLEALMNRGVDR